MLHTTQHGYMLCIPAEPAIAVMATMSAVKTEGRHLRTQMQQHDGAGHLPVNIKVHPVVPLAFIDTWVCVDRH